MMNTALFDGHDLVGPCQCWHFDSKEQTSQCHEQHIGANKKKKHQQLHQMQGINCYRTLTFQRLCSDGFTVNINFSGVKLQNTCHGFQSCCFSGTVVADKTIVWL